MLEENNPKGDRKDFRSVGVRLAASEIRSLGKLADLLNISLNSLVLVTMDLVVANGKLSNTSHIKPLAHASTIGSPDPLSTVPATFWASIYEGMILLKDGRDISNSDLVRPELLYLMEMAKDNRELKDYIRGRFTDKKPNQSKPLPFSTVSH
jgi:hypothetical protein